MAMRVASNTRLVRRKNKSSPEDEMVKEKTGLQRKEVEGCEEVFQAEVEAKYAVVLPRMNIVGRKKTFIAPLRTPGPTTSSSTPESPGEPTTSEFKPNKIGARLVLPVKPDPNLLRSTQKNFPALPLYGNVAGMVPESSGAMKRTSNTEHKGRTAALDSEDGINVQQAARGRLDQFQINLTKMSLSGGMIGDGLTWARGAEPEREDVAAIPSSTTQPLSIGEANAVMSGGCSLYEEETNREVAQLMDVGGIHTIIQPEVHWAGNLQMSGDPQAVMPRSRIPVEVAEVEDLSQLKEVCESSVILNLKKRFHCDCIYTYIGNMLLSINPFKLLNIYTAELRQQYQGRQQQKNPPHVYAIAEDTFTQSQASTQEQCIIISGQSGSGKTEATKLIVHYLSTMYQGRNNNLRQPMKVFPILESFGNAKTILNDNSSRFGKYLHIHILCGVVVGTSLSRYLLEKSRVIFQANEERNYHVFYEILAGMNDWDKQELYLQGPETYYYLNQGVACKLNGKQDKQDFQLLVHCFETIGLHANQHESFEVSHIFSDAETRRVGSLLKISSEALQTIITHRVTETTYEKIYCPLSVERAIESR
ncbi:unnamed protein product [Pleuronectes platessa]|uniref:Myosin motor domain-containing protein n=1 Tax=Pleuronectes platessa TaxID=8262 RepID=A0A9N7U3Z8_PLEPL|nr:unnamed protein product [Pleuronectes platessa]